jgi:hypothetical protein
VIESTALSATFSSGLLGAAIILFLIQDQDLDFALGAVFLGVTGQRLRLLSGAPVIVLGLMVISLLGFLGLDKNIWDRTHR